MSKQLLELGIPGADEEAIRTLANFLESQGLTMLWQVQGVPDLVVDKWSPLEDNLLSNLLLKQVRAVAKKHAQNPDGNTSSAITKTFDAQTEAIKRLNTKIERDHKASKKRQRDRSGSSSSVSVDENDTVDVPQALKCYHLHKLHVEHLPGGEVLAKASAKARKHYAGIRKDYVAGGKLDEKWFPSWMTKPQQPRFDKFSMDSPIEFAQWSSCWWSRALSQLCVQGKVGKETLSASEIINQYLQLCHMCQEEGFAHMVMYDSLLWDDINDKLAKGDRDVAPGDCMSRVVSRIREKTNGALRLQQEGTYRSHRKADYKLQSASSMKTSREDTRPKQIYCSTCKKLGNHSTQNCWYSTQSKEKAMKGDGKGRKGGRK